MATKILKYTDDSREDTYDKVEYSLCLIEEEIKANKLIEDLNNIIFEMNTETSNEEVQNKIIELYGEELFNLIDKVIDFHSELSDIRIQKRYSTSHENFYLENYIPLPILDIK